MFKRFWQSLNYSAEVLTWTMPRGECILGWKTVLRSSSAKSKVLRSRTCPMQLRKTGPVKIGAAIR